VIKASSVILATGGDAQLFEVNFHPSCITGDGYAMGYSCGAELMNMEFMQIFPAIVYPSVNMLSSVSWVTHPKILNTNYQQFMQNYLPKAVSIEECMEHHSRHGPFSTSDLGKYLEISMCKEIKAGRANDHNACYLEVDALKLLPQLIQQWYGYRGVDFTREYVEISVAHHCSNGGLKIDEYGQTTVPGLYAVGETASGPHGADRLGGAMMAFSQVFGVRAGKHAAATAKEKGLPSILPKHQVQSQLERIAGLKERSKGNREPEELMKILRKAAWQNLLVLRSKGGLEQMLKEIAHLRELAPHLSVENPPELVQALELTNLLQVGEIVTNAALMREETRGGHYREDFPERDDTNWLQGITVKKMEKGMHLSGVKLDEDWHDTPDDLGEKWWG
jgi:succinate dehydrogenase/fumarate reductase flavoprotein subunit